MRQKNHTHYLLGGVAFFIITAICCMLSGGCGKRVENDEATMNNIVDIVNEKKSYGEMLTYETDFQKNAMPFWRTNVMYNESVTMIQREDGQITAKLLFTPVKIIEVRDVTLQTAYTEGKDYIWQEGTNILVWLENSDIPYFTENDLTGRLEDGSLITGWGDTEAGWSEANPFDELGRSRIGDALYSVSKFYYEKQIAVTYEYTYEDWQGAVTEYQGELLPNTLSKLTSGERLRLAFYGDSIFTGCDSSKMYGREPGQEYFSLLLKEALEKEYGDKKITLSNPSKGGMDSAWGAENAEKLVAEKQPDIVVIGFGMNDADKTGEEIAENIRSIMDTVRAASPDCEFILVSPMVPNVKSGFLQTQSQISGELQKLKGKGVAVVDMFAVHNDILKTKDYSATSGNNVNHPNDWLIRVYAMNLISCMVKI